MRFYIVAAILVVACTLARGASPTHKAPRSRYVAFAQQIDTFAKNAVLPEFRKHPEQLKGGVLYIRFRVDRHGEMSDLLVFSSKGSQPAVDTATYVLHKVKFPPIPPEVIAERGGDLTGVQAEAIVSL